jgi:hypothetical protein
MPYPAIVGRVPAALPHVNKEGPDVTLGNHTIIPAPDAAPAAPWVLIIASYLSSNLQYDKFVNGEGMSLWKYSGKSKVFK